MTLSRLSVAVTCLAAIAISGCRYDTQSTSGLQFTDSGPSTQVMDGTDFDRMVAEVAAVEPTLRFPARIGLARISNGDLAPIPEAEADAWLAAEQQLGPEFGTFVPVNHLIAEMVATDSVGRPGGGSQLRRAVEKIRLGAARQHLDAVLIYETRYVAETTDNLWSAADFTIIGAFLLPGQSIDATAFASALLVDVRNGYPYGTANASVDDGKTASLVSAGSIGAELARNAGTVAVVQLVDDVVQMMRALKQELDFADIQDSGTVR